MRCAVCRIDDDRVRRHSTGNGEDYGAAHDGECGFLLWDAHLLRVAESTEDEHALMLWRWKRRAAEVADLPFTEPLPTTAVDRDFSRIICERGWEGAVEKIRAEIEHRSER